MLQSLTIFCCARRKIGELRCRVKVPSFLNLRLLVEVSYLQHNIIEEVPYCSDLLINQNQHIYLHLEKRIGNKASADFGAQV